MVGLGTVPLDAVVGRGQAEERPVGDSCSEAGTGSGSWNPEWGVSA